MGFRRGQFLVAGPGLPGGGYVEMCLWKHCLGHAMALMYLVLDCFHPGFDFPLAPAMAYNAGIGDIQKRALQVMVDKCQARRGLCQFSRCD